MNALADHRLRWLGDVPVTLRVSWEALWGGLNPPSSHGEIEQVATAKPLLCCLIFGSVHGHLSCLSLCACILLCLFLCFGGLITLRSWTKFLVTPPHWESDKLAGSQWVLSVFIRLLLCCCSVPCVYISEKLQRGSSCQVGPVNCKRGHLLDGTC